MPRNPDNPKKRMIWPKTICRRCNTGNPPPLPSGFCPHCHDIIRYSHEGATRTHKLKNSSRYSIALVNYDYQGDYHDS